MQENTIDFDNKIMMSEYEEDCRKNPLLIKEYEKTGISLINMSLYVGNLNFVEWLIDNGAEINVSVDGTPLYFACLYGNANIIKKIFKKTNEHYLKRSQPLTHAIYSGKTTNVDALLSLKLDINLKEGYATPLCTAIDFIEVLDEEGEFVDVSITKKLRMINHLLEKGAIIDDNAAESLTLLSTEILGPAGENILFYCMDKKILKLIPILIEHGADPNVLPSKTEEGPQILSVEKAVSLDLMYLAAILYPRIDKLKYPFIDYSLIIKMDQVYKHSSKYLLGTDSFDLLFKIGVSPNAISGVNSINVLEYSLDNSNYDLIEVLLRNGAHISLKNNYLGKLFSDIMYEYSGELGKELRERKWSIFNMAMQQKPDLSLLFTKESLHLSKAEDIFEMAALEGKYQWFEPFVEQFDKKVKEKYTSYRLLSLFATEEKNIRN